MTYFICVISQLKNYNSLNQSPSKIADFFDKMPKAEDNVWPQKKQSKAESTKDADPPSKNASLPEGFFDDPKRDAKARKVEYKDPELQEWEKFQKSIQKEDDVSYCNSTCECVIGPSGWPSKLVQPFNYFFKLHEVDVNNSS